MASIYKRTDSSYFWIRYKDSSGKWKSAITPYRKDNVGCKRQAELLAREKTVWTDEQIEIALNAATESDRFG